MVANNRIQPAVPDHTEPGSNWLLAHSTDGATSVSNIWRLKVFPWPVADKTVNFIGGFRLDLYPLRLLEWSHSPSNLWFIAMRLLSFLTQRASLTSAGPDTKQCYFSSNPLNSYTHRHTPFLAHKANGSYCSNNKVSTVSYRHWNAWANYNEVNPLKAHFTSQSRGPSLTANWAPHAEGQWSYLDLTEH